MYNDYVSVAPLVDKKVNKNNTLLIYKIGDLCAFIVHVHNLQFRAQNVNVKTALTLLASGWIYMLRSKLQGAITLIALASRILVKIAQITSPDIYYLF